MQREEFSERAQTQKMDTNQGERARLENRRRFSGELAEGALQFFALEQTLGGQAGGFGAWLQATYELNEDFEEPYSKVVDDICQAFREVERRHGTAIAQHLYDVHSVILLTDGDSERCRLPGSWRAAGGSPSVGKERHFSGASGPRCHHQGYRLHGVCRRGIRRLSGRKS